MDKRTLLFVIAMTAALFCINMFFEYQRQDELKEWATQQKARKQKQIVELQKELQQRLASDISLPIVKLFEERDTPNDAPTTWGILADDAVVVLTWQSPTPKVLYIENPSSGTHQQLVLLADPQQKEMPAIYGRDEDAKLGVGAVSYIGSYELIVVDTTDGRYETFFANYVNGQVTFPFYELQKLKAEVEERKDSYPFPITNPLLVLARKGKSYLPVGVYRPSDNDLLLLTEYEKLSKAIAPPLHRDLEDTGEKIKEQYYLLQNEYQQLVFSNYGAALVEINLPFRTDENKASVVKEIDFDRQMVEEHPYNALFPQSDYYTAGTKGKEAVWHPKGELGGYYPLLRRDLIEKGTRPSVRVLPRYYSLNIVSETPNVADLVYKVTHFDNNSIEFTAETPQQRIVKSYSFSTEGAPYVIDLDIKVEGDSRGLWLSSGVPEVEWINGAATPAQKVRITQGNKSRVELLSAPREAVINTSTMADWLSNSNGFFGIIMDPLTAKSEGYRLQPVAGDVVPSRLVEIGQDYDRFKAQDLPGYLMMLPLNKKGGSMNFRIFAGPYDDAILNQVDKIYSSGVGGNPDYAASQSFHGWFSFISEPFARVLFVLMKFFHFLTGSWALSIVLLTVALRLMLYPLNAWSTKSMVKMQQIAPQIKAIQEKYKKDPTKAQLEIMNIYREKGVNPLSGCLPLLIQLPFLIGMFDLLKSSFVLRGAEFIPGWIDDLTAPDVLFSWKTPLPFIGNEFHLLPFLLGGVMFLQQRFMSTAPKDPALMTDQQRQQRVMGNVMAGVFTVMFYHFPSGLNIYWLSSMLLGILQQWWTQKSMQGSVVAAPAKGT